MRMVLRLVVGGNDCSPRKMACSRCLGLKRKRFETYVNTDEGQAPNMTPQWALLQGGLVPETTLACWGYLHAVKLDTLADQQGQKAQLCDKAYPQFRQPSLRAAMAVTTDQTLTFALYRRQAEAAYRRHRRNMLDASVSSESRRYASDLSRSIKVRARSQERPS